MTDDTTPDPEQGEEQHVRPFTDWLREQGGGRLHAELSDRLHELIAAVQETGKGGQLVLKLEVKILPKSGGRTFAVTDMVAVKAPQPDRPQSLFYADSDGNLTRNNPEQPVLTGLRDVEPSRPPLRSAQ